MTGKAIDDANMGKVNGGVDLDLDTIANGDKTIKCPKCGSYDVKYSPLLNLDSKGSIEDPKDYVCNKCGHRFSPNLKSS